MKKEKTQIAEGKSMSFVITADMMHQQIMDGLITTQQQVKGLFGYPNCSESEKEYLHSMAITLFEIHRIEREALISTILSYNEKNLLEANLSELTTPALFGIEEILSSRHRLFEELEILYKKKQAQ